MRGCENKGGGGGEVRGWDGKEAMVGDCSRGRWVDILYKGGNRSGLKEDSERGRLDGK